MSKPKQRTGRDTEDHDLFLSDFDAEEFIGGMEARQEEDSRPARRRLDLRSEERWLKQQLSDWDDFDPLAGDSGQAKHDTGDDRG